MFLQRFCLLVTAVIIFDAIDASSIRQKRCIVVQKQSGSRDVDEGDDDEDYRIPQPKDPKPDRLTGELLTKRFDVEDIPPELLRLRKKPKWLNNRLMLRNRILKNNLYNRQLS